MNAQLSKLNYGVSARCPTCQAVTSFEVKGSFLVDGIHEYGGEQYMRVQYVLSQCAGCRRGGFAIVPDRGSIQTAVLEVFFPFSLDAAPLPSSVPLEIQYEFREAELCASLKANRAASALFRSVLEKTLKANGYTKTNDPSLRDLQKRIDAAAGDGIITDARRKRAHDEIRSLGNDVLHDDWREVTGEEVELAHRYNQRILEDLYDDRASVEAILIAKERLDATPSP